MVSKKNFAQNGRHFMQHQQQLRYDMRGGAVGMVPPAAAALNLKKPLLRQMQHGAGVGGNANRFNPMLFNASQIPDNPGYMDFNNPTPPLHANQQQPKQQQQQGGGNQLQAQQQQKRKNQKNRQKGKMTTAQQPQQQQQQQKQQQQNMQTQRTDKSWQNKNKQQHQAANRTSGRFHNLQAARPMPAAMNTRGIRRPPPFPPTAMPFHPMNAGFQPPLIPPPMLPGRGLIPPHAPPLPPPHFLRRSARGAAAMPPPPPPPMLPIPAMMQPRLPRGLPPMPFNGRIKKLNPKLTKKVVKGKSTIKTLKNLINQYPLDKPWVNDDIRREHDIKIDIENRLKGNKDDELFATFKVQRDKFVAMYESAREEHLKQEAAAVKAKDAKDKQTTSKIANKDVANTNANV